MPGSCVVGRHLGHERIVAKTVATSLLQAAMVDAEQEWLAPPQYLHGISELKTIKVPSDGGQRRRKRHRRSLTNVTSGDAKQQSPT